MVHQIPLIVQPHLDKPAMVLSVSMHIARLTNGYVVHVIEAAHLINALQSTIKQQHALMHEGRNVRAASLAHLSGGFEAIQHGIKELETLLSTDIPEPIASRVKASLTALQQAYRLQNLAIVCDKYTSIVENYLLSPTDKEEFALCAWVNSMIDMLSSDAVHVPLKKAGLLDTPIEYMVRGHKAVLLYALVNLIQNAIKFSQPKRSTSHTQPLDITVSLIEKEGAFWFSVADKGIGMNDQQVTHCLNRSAKRFNTSIQGSGSGLSSVNEALNKIGGVLAVTSVVGEGTVFKLTVPLTLTQKVIQKADYSTLCVLVADDALINIRIFTRLLSSLGVPLKNIFPVRSEAEAMVVFKKQHAMSRPINIIFTDLNMCSSEDGFILAQQVRSFEASNSLEAIPIILVSGTACEKTHPKRVLVDGEMLKPISPDGVATALMKATNNLTSAKVSAGYGEDILEARDASQYNCS